MENEIVIVDGVRTPHGVLGGAFRDLPAQKLGEIALRALLERINEIEEKILTNDDPHDAEALRGEDDESLYSVTNFSI